MNKEWKQGEITFSDARGIKRELRKRGAVIVAFDTHGNDVHVIYDFPEDKGFNYRGSASQKMVMDAEGDIETFLDIPRTRLFFVHVQKADSKYHKAMLEEARISLRMS